MFWRFGFTTSSIDTLLEDEQVTLDQVLEDEDFLHEAKSLNPKLLEFLCTLDHVKSLLDYIVATDLEDNKRNNYPFLASEIIASEIDPIIDMIVLDQQQQLLVPFWTFINREPGSLDPLQASYFCKTLGVLFSKYPQQMLNFIQSQPDSLCKILSHLKTPAIMDLLLTLVRMEEIPEGKDVVNWLSQHELLENLIERLDPYLDSEEHSIAQQCLCEIIKMSQTSISESPSIGTNELITNLTSEPVMQKLVKYMLDPDAPNATCTLVHCVSIIIDIIRHNNGDLDNEPVIISLADMLKVMADHVPEFTHLLLKPRSVQGPICTSLGEQEPLGFERLKICELFAELLHCSNMSNLNQEQESSVGEYFKSKLIEARTLPVCVDLFFAFPWNNLLHYVVYDTLHQVFNGPMDTGLNRQLAISILKDGKLPDKIIIAQKANDDECAKLGGFRAGYMGHLTFISDEIMKLFEGYPERIVMEITDHIDMEGWTSYCNNELRETKEKDQLPLGGIHPNDEVPTDEEEEDEGQEEVAAGQYLSQEDDDEQDWMRSYQRNLDNDYDSEEEEDDTPNWTKKSNALYRVDSHIIEEQEEYEHDSVLYQLHTLGIDEEGDSSVHQEA